MQEPMEWVVDILQNKKKNILFLFLKHFIFNKRYNAPPAKDKDEPVVVEDVIDFFVKFLEMDQLGERMKFLKYWSKESLIKKFYPTKI